MILATKCTVDTNVYIITASFFIRRTAASSQIILDPRGAGFVVPESTSNTSTFAADGIFFVSGETPEKPHSLP